LPITLRLGDVVEFEKYQPVPLLILKKKVKDMNKVPPMLVMSEQKLPCSYC
jgi:hypothetical protein